LGLGGYDPGNDVLCQEYHRLIELLDGFDEHVKQLTQLRALLGEELQPQ
jgi:hypothetical protein